MKPKELYESINIKKYTIAKTSKLCVTRSKTCQIKSYFQENLELEKR